MPKLVRLWCKGTDEPRPRCGVLVLVIVASLAGLGSGATRADTKSRNFEPEDYYSLREVNDPQLSPDGRSAAFVQIEHDRRADKRLSTIWVVGLEGESQPRQISDAAQSASAPRWSPDGKSIAFIAAGPKPKEGVAGKPQVQLWALAGGEPHALTHLKNGVSRFSWAPDGRRLVCISSEGPEDEVESAGDSSGKSDVRHYIHANDKVDGQGFLDERRKHLWVVEVESGKSTQITRGADWNDTDPEWSPDGRSLAFVSNRTGHEFDGSRQTDIWIVSADGGAPLRVSNHALSGWMTAGFSPLHSAPHWSPDGTQIAFLAQKEEEGPTAIWVAPRSGGPAREVVHAAEIGDFSWKSGGFYYLANFHGTRAVFQADAAGKVTQLTHADRFLSGLTVDEQHGIALYSADDFQHPGDLFTADLHFTAERQLTHLNAALLSELNLPTLARVAYKARDGLPLEGFLAKPPDWKPDRKYPLVVLIHGGPGLMYGYSWRTAEYGQALLASGVAVFIPNFRGSAGYGAPFLHAIQNEWGGRTYTDVLSGVDTVIKQSPWIDAARLGIVGASFGGYLTNWIICHTNRFSAAVAISSISDLVSLEGQRDAFYSHARDFNGDLFQNFDLYWKYSPLRYAEHVRTPTLIVHGDADQRVPIQQAEEWFRALQHFNVSTEFVVFPHEGHSGTSVIGTPRHLVELRHWINYWFARYLNQDADALPPGGITTAADTKTQPGVTTR